MKQIKERVKNYRLRDCVRFLIPGAEDWIDFLPGCDNGQGKMSKKPKIDAVPGGERTSLNFKKKRFDNATACSDSNWDKAKESGGAIRYMGQKGGLFNGMSGWGTTNHVKQPIVAPGSERKSCLCCGA